MCPKNAGWVANSVDPDQNAASDQDLHCLLRPVCPSNQGYYGSSNTEKKKSDSMEANSCLQKLSPTDKWWQNPQAYPFNF